MTAEAGPMIQQWTTGSAISHLRSFVAGVHVELDQVQRYVVTQEAAPPRALARAARLAGRSVTENGPDTPAVVGAVGGGEVTAAADSGEGEDNFLTPRAGSPDSPALMDVDQQFEVKVVRRSDG